MIKLKTSISGPDFAYGVGEEVTLDKDTEKRLVKSDQAEYVKAKKTPAGKTAKKTAKRK